MLVHSEPMTFFNYLEKGDTLQGISIKWKYCVGKEEMSGRNKSICWILESLPSIFSSAKIFSAQEGKPGIQVFVGFFFQGVPFPLLTHHGLSKLLPPWPSPFLSKNGGFSLVVQWWWLCLSMHGVWVWSLVDEVRSHMPWSQKAKT